MLKVGDKVKIRGDLEVGQKFNTCDFTKEMKKYRDKLAKIEFICGRFILLDIDNQEFGWTEDMFDKIEENNNMKELTFKEVVAKIKEGETWESTNYIIKCSHRVISIETKNGEVFNGIAFCDAILFTLQRKQYSFEEAFKSLKDGKEIESVVSGRGFKTRNSVSKYVLNNREIVDKVNDEFRLFSYNEIRNKWYIND